MPRPRILSSYNYKRRNANVKREDAGPINHIKMEVTKIEREEPDCEIIMIDDDDDDDNNDNDKNIGGGKDGKIRSVTATKAPVTIEVRRENTVELVDTEKLTRRMPLETKEAVTALCQNSSLSLQLVANTSSKAAQSMTSLSADVVQLIPNTSSRSARSVTGLSSDVVQLIPNSSTKVFHLIPNSSDGVARLVNNSSKRSTQLITNSSARVGQFVTGSSARVPRLVPCSSPRVAQMVPGSSARVAQLVPGSSARVAQLVTSSSARVPQLVPCSSARVAQLVTSSSARVPQLVTSSSARVPQLVTSSSARVPQLVPNTSARVPQLVPNTSARVPQLVPNSSARVPQLVPNSSARVPQLVPNSSARVPQLVPNSSARVPQLVPNSAARLTQLSPGSSARFAQLITNSSAQVMQLVPNASAKFAQFVPNSNAKSSNRITQLIQISPARETQLSSGSSAKLTPPIPNSSEKCTQPLTKSSAKFAQLVPKSSEKLTSKSPNDRNNSNVVMVSPVSATDTNIFQSPTICTLEKIRNLKELTRVRQVVGVPRRNNAAQNITSQQNNLSLPRNVVQQINEAKRASEMRKENFHKLHSDDTSESRKRMTEIHHVPWSEEKSQEEKFFAESQKTLIPVSRETTVDAFGIAKRALSLAKKAATKGPQARVKLVDVRKMMNKPGNTGKQARNLDKIEENVKIESYDDKTTGKSVKTSKSTILVNRRKNIRLNARKNQKNPKLSVLSRIQSRLTKALSGLDHPARNKWRAQCIVCKSRFTDKYEFHRHATLSHPGIRIVFCELCSSSFRTDDELRQHRSSYHKITVIKDAEGNLTTIEPPEETTRTTTTTIETVVKRENESQRPRTIKKERKALNRKKMTNDNRGNADSVAGHSRTSEIFRPRLTKKKVAGSSVRARNWKKMSQTGSTYNGVRRRRPQTKNKTAKSTYNYVDVDVIRYDAIATKNKFKSAEIKKLIVPLTRLEGPVLEKYLKKYDTSPVMNFTSIILKKSRDTLGNNEKSLISTNSKKTAINSGSRIANEKSAKKSIKLYTEKVRKNRRSRSNETENFTISHDSTIVIDSNRSNENVEPRRSTRRRRANKFLYSDSDDSTDDDSTNIHSLDNDEERTKNQLSTRERKSQKVGRKKFDTKIRTGQDFTSIEIDETEKIAEIVKEQRVIRKLISRSSFSSSVTLENNRDKNFPNTEKRLETDDGDTEMSYSPLRNISIYTSSDDNPLTESTRPKNLQTTTSKCSKSKQTSSSDEEASRDYVNFEKSRNLPSKGSERSSGEEVPLSNRVKFQQSRLLRANSSKSSNSEETLNSDKMRSESSRYLLRKNLTERDLSKNPKVLGKCDGATDETTRKIDKKAAEDKLIGGKNDGEDNEVKETNDEENNRRKEKIDNENKQSNEKNDSEKNEQKDQINDDEKQTKGNSNDANKRETEKSDDEGIKSKEKSDGEGERSREKSDDEEKKSNVVEKKANEKTNDGDKQSEERIDDEDKEQKEKIDDEDKESKEKSDGEGKQSKENADGEGKQSKENSDGEGKQSKEKTDGEGEQSREKTDGEGKQSKEKSSGVEKQQNEKSDDGDKQPEERIDDEDKEPMEKIDDEDKEPNEETDDENEGPEVKIDNENERLNEKINDNGKKQLIDRNSSKNARQSRDKNKDKKHLKDMNNGDNKKRPKDKNNGEPKKLKEKHDYTRETIPRGPFESTVRKTYSSSKKPSKASKCLKQLWQREKSSDSTNSQDLCIVCKELFALMKKISSQVPERNTSETPIKCPSCQRYFISMFHLELHVATNHLRCRNKVSCKKLQLSTIEKLSQDDVIDCQTELEIAIECSRCTLKFTSEKDLNDHLIKQHETPTLRDASSSNESPEYLKDLRTSCFQTIFGEKIGPSTRQNNESTDRRENVKNTLDNSTSEIEKNRIPTVNCSLCDEKFVKITEYVCHVRQRHHIFKRSSLTNSEKNLDKTANSTEPKLFGKEESSLGVSRTLNDDEINLSLKHNPNDQMSADREYVLKQLLSDDSNDDENEKISKINPSCHRESSKRTLQETTRKKITDESAKGTVVGYLSSLHTCKVCRKTFTRAQDLLMHGLHHLDSEISMMSDDNIDNLSEKKSNKRRQELFVDSMSNDHGENIEDFATTPYEEFDPTTRDGFADCSENESDNVAVVYGYDGASEKVLFGSKRRATSPLDESPKVTSNEVKPIRSKKRKICATEKISRDKSYCSPEQQSRSAKNDTMRELMETEMGLAGETNDKLPIACGKCNRHFANRSLLNEHLFFLHDDSLKDTVLTDVLPPTSSLTGTVEGASSKQRLQCETCLQNFKLLQGYSRHRYFAHGDDSMVHVCENCSKVLTNVTMVNVHICTDMASYNCRTCDEKFSTGMSLRLHNMEKHPETEGPHVCKPCEKNFLTRAMLERHEKSKHRLSRPYRARKSSPVRMSINDEDMEKMSSDNVEKRDNATSEELDSGCDENCDGEIDSSITIEPIKSRRGRWRACRNKTITRNELPVERKRSRINRTPGKRRRGRPRKYPSTDEESPYQSSQDDEENSEKDPKIDDVWRESTLFIDETEINQCSLCQLYCLTKSALRNHMVKIHSTPDEVCQLCQKMYPAGKLIRHMIDRHISSDDCRITRYETGWQIGTNSNEIDTEIFVRMLGIRRLVSLCEYRRYTENIVPASYKCPYCVKTFPSNELYRYHFLLNHDEMCALCNIEYKKGHDAARHKSEIHGSVGRYIWFADRTIMAVMSTKNFAQVAESIFIEMLTKDDDDDDVEDDDTIDDETDDSFDEDDLENLDCTEILVYSTIDENNVRIVNEIETCHEDRINLTKEIFGTIGRDEDTNRGETRLVEGTSLTKENIGRIKNEEQTRIVEDTNLSKEMVGNVENDKNTGSTITSETRTRREIDATLSFKSIPRTTREKETMKDDRSIVSDDFAEADDVQMIIVVTDEDLERFNITTRHPNIWGLSAKISSTFDGITPKEVKEILERYFERQEDFDT